MKCAGLSSAFIFHYNLGMLKQLSELLLAFAVHLPALLVALCLSVYWTAVVIKLVILASKIGKDPNAMPRERVGQLMRLIWYPAIILQVLHAWRMALGIHWPYPANQVPPFFRLPFDRPPMWWWIAAPLATMIVILCTRLTFVCWHKMGRSWRIGIDPGETLELVSTGPYRYVRHPIYALRILLDLCAIVVIPTPFMAVVTFIDIILLQIEARREERYMEAKHGAVYGDYKKNVGRFVPRRLVV